MTSITTSEWVKALEQAMSTRPAGDEGMTRRELAEALGVSHAVMGERMRTLHKAGMVIAGRAPRPKVDGVMQMTAVYRLKA